MKENILISIIVILIVFNTYVTYKLMKDEYYGRKQKVFQFLIIWLLPLVGVLLVYFFLNKDENNKNNPYGGGANSDWAGGNEYSSGGGSGD